VSVYKYPESKVIDEVTFKKTERGSVRAYMHARSDVPKETIRTIIDDLRARDFECIPFSINGQPVVEVRGFKKEPKLLEWLQQHELIQGNPKFVPDPEDKFTWQEKLKKRSLQAAGALYFIGDISFFWYGVKGKSPLDMSAGVAYGLPSPVLMAYGRNDQSEIQIKDAAREMAKHFKKEVANLPEDCSLHSLTRDHHKGLLGSTSELFTRFPSEFMNLCYATAGACIAVAATKNLQNADKIGAPVKAVEGWLKHLQETQSVATQEMAASKALSSVKTENYLNFGVGASTVASGLFGAAVKEKAHDPDSPRKDGLEGVWEWVRERPLAITGTGFMLSTLLHAAATAVAMRGKDNTHKESVLFRGIFVASALLAELMVAISSKGHGEGVVSDTSVDDSVVAVASDLIVKQPKAMQNTLIDYMGKFLGRPDMLAIGDRQATERLRRQVEITRENPWALAERDGVKEAVLPNAPASAKPKWQAKVVPALGNGLRLQPSV